MPQVTEHELRVQIAEALLAKAAIRRDNASRRVERVHAMFETGTSSEDMVSDAEMEAALAVEAWKIRMAKLDLVRLGVK